MTQVVAIRFVVGPLHWEGPTTADLRQLPSWVAADLSVEIGSDTCFAEPEVNVVELALLAATWLADPARPSFVYNSVEADETILEFHLLGNDNWHVTSELSGASCGPVSHDALASAVTGFVAVVQHRLQDDLGVRWDDIADRFRAS